MARKAAKSLAAAEKRALAGDNESQDSQEIFDQIRLNHAVGMLSSSPVPGQSPKKASAVVSSVVVKTMNTARISRPGLMEPPESTKQPPNASNAVLKPDATSNSSTKTSQRRVISPNSSPPFRDSEISEPALVPVQLVSDDVASVIEPSQPSGNDGLAILPPPALSPLKKKKTGEMSSDSPTQSNDGRSYEQYSHENSQRLQSSSQASNVNEHSTLHEDDTGYLNFRRTPYDIPESVHEDVELDFAHDSARVSQPTSQAIGANSLYAIAPETPAIGRGLFQGGNGAVIPPSQLFGQTQYTSAVKKASPTSSRPSPDVFHQNAISPNLLASSPLKHRGFQTSPTNALMSSSAPFGASSRPSDDKTPSAPTNSRDDDDADEGNATDTPVPPLHSTRRKHVLEPISEYKSWRKQSTEISDRKSSSLGAEGQDSDSDVDTTAYRRRLARSRKERASKSFPSISLPRSSSNKGDKVEVPSTNRPKPIQDHRKTDADQYLEQCHGKPTTDNDGSQETVADSQEAQAPPQHIDSDPKASDESNDNDPNVVEDQVPDLPNPRAPALNVDYRETIPETSPVSTAIEPPRLIGDIMREQSSAKSGLDTVSFPTLSGFTDFEHQPKGSNDARTSSLPEEHSSIPTDRKPEPSRNRAAHSPTPSIVLASSPQSVIRRSTRLSNMTTPSSTGHFLSQPGSKTSTLTSLSATPSMTSSITPSTEPDRVPETARRKSSSPAVAQPRRGKPPPSSGPPSLVSKIKANSRSRGGARRLTRHNSMSTDELAGSPLSTASNEQPRAPIRRLGRQSLAGQHLLREPTVKQGIFEGMVFALTFQQVRKSKDKATDRNTIERMIRQEGGKVLGDGFDELFRFDSFQATGSATANHTLSSSLTLLDDDTRFTALIADGHSRKVKYMQALALGIPCLAPKWITTCIARKEIIDWTSYLLCAGPSALLGDAIRSRVLQPFDASTAKLADVINNRPKLLDEARILLVMKAKDEEKKLPYVFLAQVLGGSLVRVRSLEEARAKLREGESLDQPFDWVYIDDNLHNAQRALFGSATDDTTSKKRKRKSVDSKESDQPPKKIRTLDHELVIQSLILGRLIEEGEMEE
ncbi:hypothetical protein F4821DRAFT_237392 [Hypoxylon rubiginosum]|uniref:Uncharacterized protein n=1 Tax=Hypoxylon rubiginosum TaxID=110542 RepID=A0ACC0D3T9_9PEZI|nr:hypothetical protein F4821DRAFT_237392 [Hypoxylon rubiginosum]